MRQEFRPAIEALQKDISKDEHKIIEKKKLANWLCGLAGVDFLYRNIGVVSEAGLGVIKGGAFNGKSIVTAAREYLDLRRVSGLGPATPREVYEALKEGGIVFDSKKQTNSITVVRGAMRKASAVFHRLPNGRFGLVKWYGIETAIESGV